jgi:hypothetical protein
MVASAIDPHQRERPLRPTHGLGQGLCEVLFGDGGVFEFQRDMDARTPPQRQFFEYAGRLFSVVIALTSSMIEVGASRALRAVARGRALRRVEQGVT